MKGPHMKGSCMKAQAAVELVIILSIILIVLVYVFQYSMDVGPSSYSKFRLAQAEGTARDIVHAAEMVYSEGVGATARLFITIPEMTESVTLSEEGVSMGVYVGGEVSDVPVGSNARLCGSLPQGTGGYWINLEAREGCVYISQDAMGVSPRLASFSLYQGNYSNSSVQITNYRDSEIDVNISVGGGDLPIGVNISTNVSSIMAVDAGTGAEFLVEARAQIWAITGSYSAPIEITALGGEEVLDSFTLMASVNIGSAGGGVNITIFPGSWDFGSASGGETDSKLFKICNNFGWAETVDANLTSNYLSFVGGSLVSGMKVIVPAGACNSVGVYLDSTPAPVGEYAESLTVENSDWDVSLVQFEVE